MLAQILIDPNLETRKLSIYSELESCGFLNTHPDLLILEDTEKLGIDQVKKIISNPFLPSERQLE